jgi:hemolysin III
MTDTVATADRPQTVGEEIANTISHGLGLLAAIVAVPILVVTAARAGSAAAIVGASIFAATMVTVYFTSTLYHALPEGRPKRIMQVLDHAAIFLLIAGTYTPFTLGVLSGPWGWTLFGMVWALGLGGVLLKAICGVRYPLVSLGLYLATGWVAIIAIKPLWLSLETWGLFWIAAGGLAYTGGVAFFWLDRLHYRHFIWHLFVMAGTACHFVAVLLYAA